MLGNKADLETLRAVSPDASREVACQHKCEHFEVSAKTGENVLSSLITMVERMVALEAEQNTTTSVIHLHNQTSNVEHTPNKHKCCLSHA